MNAIKLLLLRENVFSSVLNRFAVSELMLCLNNSALDFLQLRKAVSGDCGER
jgi:hypothetical protein